MKKIICILLLFFSIFVMTACEKDETPVENEKEPTVVVTPTQEPTPTKEETVVVTPTETPEPTEEKFEIVGECGLISCNLDLTNFRLWDKICEQELHDLILSQYVVDDSHNTLIVDNAQQELLLHYKWG